MRRVWDAAFSENDVRRVPCHGIDKKKRFLALVVCMPSSSNFHRDIDRERVRGGESERRGGK